MLGRFLAGRRDGNAAERVTDQNRLAWKIRHFGDDLVHHGIQRHVRERCLIVALTGQVDGLGAVAALLQLGDGLAPAPGTMKRPVNQQELRHVVSLPLWPLWARHFVFRLAFATDGRKIARMS